MKTVHDSMTNDLYIVFAERKYRKKDIVPEGTPTTSLAFPYPCMFWRLTPDPYVRDRDVCIAEVFPELLTLEKAQAFAEILRKSKKPRYKAVTICKLTAVTASASAESHL